MKVFAVRALANGWSAEPEVRAVIAALAEDASENTDVREVAESWIQRVLPKLPPAATSAAEARIEAGL